MDRNGFLASAPGASPDDAPDTLVRYRPPAALLAAAITGYNAYGKRGADEQVDLFLPAPAMICVTVDAGPVTAQIGPHRFGPLARVSLYGPSSRTVAVTSHGGVNVGIGIGPIGWSRLTRRSAADIHNRIVPLATMLSPDLAASLERELDRLDDPRHLAARLDALLALWLDRPGPDEARIAAVSALIVEDSTIAVEVAAQRLGMTSSVLRRTSIRYFGMPPKLLLRRARFLRSFVRYFLGGGADGYDVIDPSYFDASHFLRDAEDFLGMTPRRFIAQSTPFLDASIRTRAATLGAPVQALHQPA